MYYQDFGFTSASNAAAGRRLNEQRAGRFDPSYGGGKFVGGKFVGLGADGRPLYSLLTRASLDNLAWFHNFDMARLRHWLRQILQGADSRRIFYFLCLNLSFTFVEIIYGVWTNSLGLISDGFHMLFDCSSLLMGLVASIMAHWSSTRRFSFGYGRIETLSGFVNGLFLLCISTSVFSAACHRLFDPPKIISHRLLFVSVLGLLVNLFGIFAFRSSSHMHSHSHSHGHGHSHNVNLEGVFLHVLADTLGSVGVIVSSLLIQLFDWHVADPICSIFIAALIFLSVWPLLRETTDILLLRTPSNLVKPFSLCLQQILSIPGVLSYRDERIWQHVPGQVFVSIHLLIESEANDSQILQNVNAILRQKLHAKHCAIQLEKDEYFLHLSVIDGPSGQQNLSYQATSTMLGQANGALLASSIGPVTADGQFDGRRAYPMLSAQSDEALVDVKIV